MVLGVESLSSEDIKFISGTEACRSVSNLFFFGSLIFLISHEFGITDSFLNWIPSLAAPIVLALLGIGLRVIAIDRFLRMARQRDYEAKQPSYDE
jgi:hypothetical protein